MSHDVSPAHMCAIEPAYCNTLATHCTTLHHTASHCTTLHRTATHCGRDTAYPPHLSRPPLSLSPPPPQHHDSLLRLLLQCCIAVLVATVRCRFLLLFVTVTHSYVSWYSLPSLIHMCHSARVTHPCGCRDIRYSHWFICVTILDWITDVCRGSRYYDCWIYVIIKWLMHMRHDTVTMTCSYVSY